MEHLWDAIRFFTGAFLILTAISGLRALISYLWHKYVDNDQ